MRHLLFFLGFSALLSCSAKKGPQRVFDVHLHGSKDPTTQLADLEKAGVYKAAISTSWDLQLAYTKETPIDLLYGLMFPCPNGKVPYSLQACFEDGEAWPSLSWVETQIKDGKIDFFGEILSQYYGISSSDSALLPYYALAEKYELPVGIHTGGAGPGHGSPHFKMELGNPNLLEATIRKFPRLRIWIMHAGHQFYKETIATMQANKQVYTDISVLSNPDIVTHAEFTTIMKAFVEAGLEDRLMFGTDNGPADKVIAAVSSLDFLSDEQKAKIFYKNAEKFFTRE